MQTGDISTSIIKPTKWIECEKCKGTGTEPDSDWDEPCSSCLGYCGAYVGDEA